MLKDLQLSRATSELLPLHDVAGVFADEAAVAMTQNKLLSSRVCIYQHLISDMRRWIASTCNLHYLSNTLDEHACAWRSTPLLAHCPTYQYVALDRDAHVRTLAKSWVAQHVYHNTDRAFQFVQSRPVDTFTHEEFDFASPNVNGLESWQTVFPSFARSSRLAPSAQSQCHLALSHLDQEHDETTSLYRTPSRPGRDYWNLLVGHFNDRHDRYVSTIRRVQDDEHYARGDLHEQHALQWYTLTSFRQTNFVV
ncbi:Aste57867_15853 [Aphanomyces stellatus]|uniref:Aste57867_15853 protein n=1 Tax=Aphanomyces stellatus TaxID=120398 RepID=A0A485L4E2_9STRA|nr:hypothetical protein As57867_015797 [Aphanomyces stellatus]VFT92640.1 Aste57867_15853 [Aphanomyces stellatus]